MSKFYEFDFDNNYRIGTYELGDLRAVIERDVYAEAPDSDRGDPILDDDGTQRYGAPVPDDVVAAFAKTLGSRYYGREWEHDTFERYVRIFHGGTVSWINGGSRGEEGRYAVLALPELRRELGVPEEHVNDKPDATEWTAYVEGDVYSIRVERKVRWVEEGSDLEDDPRTMTTWETVEDTECGGLYGDEHAAQAAIDALADVEREVAA